MALASHFVGKGLAVHDEVPILFFVAITSLSLFTTDINTDNVDLLHHLE